MTREEFSAVLQQLQGHTRYIYYHLMGEPLTHPLLPEFLDMAEKQGFRSVLTTNGTLLDSRGQALIDARVHKVNISVHSFEQGGDAAFCAYLSKVADFAQQASVQGILVSLRLWNKGCDHGRNEKILAFFRERWQEDWQPNSRGYRIQDKLYLEWGDRFQWPDKNAPLRQDVVTCRGLEDHFGILCDGTVVPCCLDSEGEIALGNIFREDIGQILSSQRAKAMVQGFACRTPTEELCHRCQYASRFR